MTMLKNVLQAVHFISLSTCNEIEFKLSWEIVLVKDFSKKLKISYPSFLPSFLPSTFLNFFSLSPSFLQPYANFKSSLLSRGKVKNAVNVIPSGLQTGLLLLFISVSFAQIHKMFSCSKEKKFKLLFPRRRQFSSGKVDWVSFTLCRTFYLNFYLNDVVNIQQFVICFHTLNLFRQIDRRIFTNETKSRTELIRYFLICIAFL